MTNNRIVIACLLSWVAFIPGVTWPPLLYFLDVVNALGFTFGFAVLWRYVPGAAWAMVKVFSGEPIGRGAMLVLGIVQTWAAMVVRTAAIWHWRWHLEPDGGLDSLPMAIAAYLIIGGGACHLAASTMKEDCVEAPILSAKLLWSAMIAGLIIGAAIAYGRWVRA